LIKAYKALQGLGHNIWYRGKKERKWKREEPGYSRIDKIQKKEELAILPK